MRKRIFRSLITLGTGIILHCDGSNLTKAQCYESHHCEANYNSCVLKQSLTASNSFSGTSSVSVPATTYPPSSPSTSSEDEPNDTFYDAFFTSASGLSSDAFNSFLLLASLSASSDIDIYVISPTYQVSVYFKTMGPASCTIYWQNHYGIDMPNTSTPDSYFNFVSTLNTTPQNLEILTQGGEYIFLCSGSSTGSYSIQTDPGPNAKNQYIQFHHLGGSSGGLNFFEATGVSNCSSAHKACVSACDKKFIY